VGDRRADDIVDIPTGTREKPSVLAASDRLSHSRADHAGPPFGAQSFSRKLRGSIISLFPGSGFGHGECGRMKYILNR
jgi:hypothetical protein